MDDGAAEIAQIRLEGSISARTAFGLEALVSSGPLAQLWADLRDWDGHRWLKVPARVVQLHYEETEAAPTIEVRFQAVLLTDRAIVAKVSTATLQEIAGARKQENGEATRLSRRDIERRDEHLRELRKCGCSVQALATVSRLSQRCIREITRETGEAG